MARAGWVAAGAEPDRARVPGANGGAAWLVPEGEVGWGWVLGGGAGVEGFRSACP